MKIPMNERVCFNCGSKTTRLKRQKSGNLTQDWANIDGNPWCKRCIINYKYNPKYDIEYRREYNKKQIPRLLLFKGRVKTMKEPPRIGFCNICKKNIGDEYLNYKGEPVKIKQTHIHHINYHSDDVLKDTIELCASCHRKISAKKIEIL